MPWLTILLAASATATLLAGGAQLRVWTVERGSTERLFFSIACVGVAATTLLELRLLHVATPGEFGETLRWMHLSGAVAIIAIAWFAVTYLRAGPIGLAWAFTLSRSLLIGVNFARPGNASFAEVTAIRTVEFLGESVTAAVAVDSPWRDLARLSMLLLILLVVLATVSAHRNRTRERPFVFGGLLLSSILLFAWISSKAGRGTFPGPLPSIGFVAFLLAAYAEMGRDLARSVENAQALAAARRRMARAAEAGQITLWELEGDTGRLWTYRDPGSGEASPAPAPETLEDFLNTVHPEDRDRVRDGISHAFESGGKIDEVYRLAAPRETTRWMEVAGGVDGESEAGGTTLRGAMWEITARMEAEAELEVQREALARAERTRTLGHLSDGLAHELRQPLGSILRDVDTAELLLERSGEEAGELRAVVGALRAGVDRAAAVLEHIQNFSTAQPTTSGPVDLGSLVEETVALVRREAVRDSMRIRYHIEPDLPPIHGDRILLQQVLVNLLVNAFDAVRGLGSDSATVSVDLTAHGDGRQSVEVADSGPGLTPEVARRVFDPFYTTKPEGSGMGLWIARSIVERHGGRLELAPRKPGETRFRFILDSMEASNRE